LLVVGLMNNIRALCLLALIIISATFLSCHAAGTVDLGPILGCIKMKKVCSVNEECLRECASRGWNTHRCICTHTGHCCHYPEAMEPN
uniref:Knottin scorpion toxin-like domain-containing protein n=1 Tax=Aegilops tauschii subsp. strangulata TaxID=200361 RepID=A0A453Q611_AEGTS